MDANDPVVEKGREIFSLMEAEQPAVFDRHRWAGELMHLAMKDPHLKVQLFRFVDAFPTLTSSELITRHLREYFLSGEAHLSPIVQQLLVGASSGLASGVTSAILRRNIMSFARTFIAGETPASAGKTLQRLRETGRTFTVDLLGEAALSEQESSRYSDLYLELVEHLAADLRHRHAPAPLREDLFPYLNVSVKASSLFPRIGPLNYEESVEQVRVRLRPIFRKVREAGGFINLDMEMFSLKNITIESFIALLDEEEFAGWNGAGIALQAYLKETEEDLYRLAEWAESGRRKVTVRLVKGAYWEYETVNAAQKGWPSPVFPRKTHTDWNFERCAEFMLRNSHCITSAFGTHNVRTLAFVLATAERVSVPSGEFEVQMLYGMAEPVKSALREMGQVVREYVPIGELLPGMAYLVRRLLENTSNEGFLRQAFVENVDRDALLAPPEPWRREEHVVSSEEPGFRNEPPLDFSLPENRRGCREAVQRVRGKLGSLYPVVIDGKEYPAGNSIESRNPSNPDEIVGTVFGIDRELADRAVASAVKAQAVWRAASAQERADVLFRAAAIARRDRLELLAWQVLETGKNWAEADADVIEAIDYLEYYGREMLRLGGRRRLICPPGEENLYHYQPRGVGLVIAPWNFPLAISVGMTAAALVTGNTVLYKPSSLSPVNGWQMFRLFREAGLPDGVLSFVPGKGEAVGDHLVAHTDIDFIAFTGSREVGLHIVELAGRKAYGQRSVKHCVIEMGGKNAIIVDEDADLDQAVAGVVHSAFSYQGQKCSACSRVIVLAGCYDRFVQRLADAVRTIAVGPAEDPACFMGPVIEGGPRDVILGYIETAREEGRVIQGGPVPESGWYVPPTLALDLPPESRLLREEIFGPVLAVMRAKDLDEALRLANGTDFALTGGVYSRSPATIQRVMAEFRAGNLYINRSITGAIVGRQPFGGFGMSGLGSKAGGSDYLLQFMVPRVITENTMRRGFTPEVIA
ncbi:proline dehydrogenase family protein [Geobacter sp. DSM 9736]|uniref:proline dehydrogenase family protein n=1 Tax=Geobacter sp. DSM 9736 TaxID=1277350 RepID=UPI000B4FE526|nr:proline dehydrogenase family protein [Geobacter sp. DSM 9736]SNB47739.1 L-proline dehydrogenase [Geobacter sp. DSM 9736]